MNHVLLLASFSLDVNPHFYWGVVVGIVLIWSLYIIRRSIKDYLSYKTTILEKQLSQEKTMKDDAFKREKEWAQEELENRAKLQALRLEEQQNQLDLKKQEFKEITITTKLLEKINNLDNLNQELEKYKNEFEKLKKQINDTVLFIISEKETKNKE